MTDTKRLTRKQKQALTRQMLLAAGEEEICRHGIHALSVRTICSSVGLTLGAFYSNFPSRNDFLTEISGGISKRFLGVLVETAIEASTKSPREIEAAFIEWMKGTRKNRDLARAMCEFSSLAHTDSDFRKRYTAQVVEFKSGLARVLNMFFATQCLRPAMTFEQMASGFMSMWVGLTTYDYLPNAESNDLALPLFLSELIRAAKPIRPEEQAA